MAAQARGTPGSQVITALTPTERNPARIAIRVGWRAVATLPARVVADLGLEVGRTWSDDDARRVAEAVAFDRAYRAAARRIDRRPLARQKVADKLRERGVGDALRDQVLARLERVGLVDDAALARQLLEGWRARRALGPALLRARLVRRGFDEALIDRLLGEDRRESGRDDLAEATELARAQAAKLARHGAAVARRRIAALLARRGYDEELIGEALGRALPTAGDDEHPET